MSEVTYSWGRVRTLGTSTDPISNKKVAWLGRFGNQFEDSAGYRKARDQVCLRDSQVASIARP